MHELIPLAAAALPVATVATGRYTAIPLFALIAERLNAISFPGSVGFLETGPALLGAAGVWSLGIVSQRMHRPPRLRTAERVLGVPAAAVVLAGIGLGAASRAGLHGALTASDASPSEWLATREWGLDAVVLTVLFATAVPFAFFGKFQRVLIERIPFAETVHGVLMAVAMITAALLVRLPGWFQVVLAVVTFSAFVVLGVMLVRRAYRLLRAWSQKGLTSGQRTAALLEIALPGAGVWKTRGFLDALPRLSLGLLLAMLCLVTGPLSIALYALVGMGGALRLLPAEGTGRTNRKRPDDDEDEAGRPAPIPSPPAKTAPGATAPKRAGAKSFAPHTGKPVTRLARRGVGDDW